MEGTCECDHCYDCHLLSVSSSEMWGSLLTDSGLREDTSEDRDRGRDREDGVETEEGTGRIC